MGRVLKLTVAYDGTRFVGWQRQAEGESIQGALEDALARFEGGPVTVNGAGRTDAGVHALAQVASVRVTFTLDAATLVRAGAQAVKLEGGDDVTADCIRACVRAGIPVMGHVGLTPQSVHQFGGYRIQGREKARREAVLRDAEAVEEAGAFSVVLEGMPLDLAQEITERLTIPTIGIGAGVHCDGQVLVWQDAFGLRTGRMPRFVKQYADVRTVLREAAQAYEAAAARAEEDFLKADAFVNAARAWENAGETDKAIAVLRRVVTEYRETASHPVAQLRLGQLGG